VHKGLLRHDEELVRLRLAPALWRRLSAEDRDRVCNAALAAIERYVGAANPSMCGLD